jgi:hypothetical protein
MDARHTGSESIEQLLLLGSIFFLRDQPLRPQSFEDLEPILNGHGWRDARGRGNGQLIRGRGLLRNCGRGRPLHDSLNEQEECLAALRRDAHCRLRFW